MTIFSYGDYKVDTTKLPPVSVDALIRRGLSHFLGNEQASKVAAHFDGKSEAESTDAAKAAFKAECQAKAVEALGKGTIGANVRGPRGSQVETIARQLVEKELRDILKHHGLTMPSGDKVVEFASGEKLTKADLITRRMAKHGERINAEAAKELAKRERDAAKAGDLDTLL
jgi:hypothetical protein